VEGAEEGFDEGEVGFGVDADGVVVGGGDVDGDVVFEEAELFEALGLFEEAGREGGEEVEGGAGGVGGGGGGGAPRG
jgi:hypothetical protein